MTHQRTTSETPYAGGRWPHWLAWALVCGTFPLIWVGGLVTTYDAGMAVPDWPNTYGYNLFLYPLESWLAVWDIFLEHTHRLIGAGVGLITIALLVAIWRCDPRRSMRALGVAALVGVSFQGTLGGLRVIGDETILANVHGCTAPIFFALAAALVARTSRRWFQIGAVDPAPGKRFQALAVATTVAIYLQIVLGAQLRHVSSYPGPGWFDLWLWLHLINAGLAAIGIVAVVVLTRRGPKNERILRRRAAWLGLLFLAQLLLGVGTWVTNFGWPGWFTDYILAIEYTVVAEGALQAVITTAHVAFGSLSLIAAVSLMLWTGRLRS